jgi:L-aspartate oxidase
VRGEGAVLVDEHGVRFMTSIHADAELAPRDVVARAIWAHQAMGHRVFLDATKALGPHLPRRFPTAFENAASLGIDARVEPMEISPAEHFHMGGIATDTQGRTTLAGLWAVGEVASTGLHGANRLASNSLLEGSVMGARVASSISADSSGVDDSDLAIPADAFARIDSGLHAGDQDVRDLAWRHLGIVRDADGIAAVLDALDAMEGPRTDARVVAELIAVAARDRTESRGSHYRSDHPDTDPSLAHRSFIEPGASPSMSLVHARAMAS